MFTGIIIATGRLGSSADRGGDLELGIDAPGLDLARNLLALKPNVPIILASGYALNSVVQNLGPNVRTIVKPFEASEIDSLITDLCAA